MSNDGGDGETVSGLLKSDYYLLPECPQRGAARKGMAPVPPPTQASARPPYASISLESLVGAHDGGLLPQEDFDEPRGNSPSAAPWLFGKNSAADADSAAGLDSGDAANLACLKWSDHHHSASIKFGVPPANPVLPGRESNSATAGLVRRDMRLNPAVVANFRPS